MNGEHFPGRLRELREGAGLTQTELAERVGVKRDAVARWEAGNREPVWSSIIALAAALGVDCRAFLEAPVNRPRPKPGRPPKAPQQGEPAPKRPKAKPKNGE